MKIISFNINSIRARPHQLIHLRDTLDPDVIGLQETVNITKDFINLDINLVAVK